MSREAGLASLYRDQATDWKSRARGSIPGRRKMLLLFRVSRPCAKHTGGAFPWFKAAGARSSICHMIYFVNCNWVDTRWQ